MISFFRLFQQKILSAALLFFLCSIIVPTFALAQAGTPTCPPPDPDAPAGSTRQSIEVKIFLPGVTKQCLDTSGNKIYYVENLQRFIGAMYRLLVGMAGILAVFMMMAAGYYWLFAAGNTSMVQKAKDLIYSSMLGLFLAASSYIILLFINPALVQLPTLDFAPPEVSGVQAAATLCSDGEEEAIRAKTPTFGCGSINYPNLGTRDCSNLTGDAQKECFENQFAGGCMGTRCGYTDDQICYIKVKNGQFSSGTCRGSLTVGGTGSSTFAVPDIDNTTSCGEIEWSGSGTAIVDIGGDCPGVTASGWCYLVDRNLNDTVDGTIFGPSIEHMACTSVQRETP